MLRAGAHVNVKRKCDPTTEGPVTFITNKTFIYEHIVNLMEHTHTKWWNDIQPFFALPLDSNRWLVCNNIPWYFSIQQDNVYINRLIVKTKLPRILHSLPLGWLSLQQYHILTNSQASDDFLLLLFYERFSKAWNG